MTRVRAAVQRLLASHDPYPGVAIDRLWNLVLANDAARRLVALLPAELAGPPLNVFRACLHPAQVARQRRAQHVGRAWLGLGPEEPFDGCHGLDHPLLFRLGQSGQQGADVIVRAPVERGEGLLPALGEAQQRLPAISTPSAPQVWTADVLVRLGTESVAVALLTPRACGLPRRESQAFPTLRSMDMYERLERLYAAFNQRDIERVLEALHPEVDWPNGWEGGRVHGVDAVRAYWLRQWQAIDPQVNPVRWWTEPDGRVGVEVHQVVRPVGGHGPVLADSTVEHVYRLRDGLVDCMEIREPAVG